MSDTKEALQAQKAELENRLAAIRKDLGRGLGADSSEQAVELENFEVLQEIARVAEQELAEIDKKLAALND